jgi:hypothetical protein
MQGEQIIFKPRISNKSVRDEIHSVFVESLRDSHITEP